MRLMIWAIGAVIVALLVRRAALWADDRGWIAIRKEHRRNGLGVGMMSIVQIYSPSIEHVVEEVYSAQTRAEQDESGEGRDTDGPADEVP